MHIGLVCPEYPPGLSANGVSTYTALLAEELASRGHSAILFCLKGDCGVGPEDRRQNALIKTCSAGPRICRVPLVRSVYYRLGTRLLAGRFQSRDFGMGLRDAVLGAHREHPIDVLECPEARGLPDWIQLLGIPVIVRLHAPRAVAARANGERRNRGLRAVMRAERRCLQGARFLTAPTRAVVAETERALGIKLRDVRIIPNPAGVGSRGTIADKFADFPEILFVGRIDLVKGFDVLIRAFDRLAGAAKHASIHLKVVGPERGLLLDGRRPVSGATFITRTVQNAAVASRIDLLGPLPYDEVQKLRFRGRITVIPSRFENFAGTIVEAMAAECPVVASDAGGSPEIVQHGRNGLLFRSGDAADLATQLDRLLTDEDLRTRLATQARIDVQTRYNPALVGGQMAEFYGEVVDRFGGSGRRL